MAQICAFKVTTTDSVQSCCYSVAFMKAGGVTECYKSETTVPRANVNNVYALLIPRHLWCIYLCGLIKETQVLQRRPKK